MQQNQALRRNGDINIIVERDKQQTINHSVKSFYIIYQVIPDSLLSISVDSSAVQSTCNICPLLYSSSSWSL